MYKIETLSQFSVDADRFRTFTRRDRQVYAAAVNNGGLPGLVDLDNDGSGGSDEHSPIGAAGKCKRDGMADLECIQVVPSGQGQPFVDIEIRVTLYCKKFIQRQNLSLMPTNSIRRPDEPPCISFKFNCILKFM